MAHVSIHMKIRGKETKERWICKFKQRIPSERVGIETRTVHRLPGKGERDEFAPCPMREERFALIRMGEFGGWGKEVCPNLYGWIWGMRKRSLT